MDEEKRAAKAAYMREYYKRPEAKAKKRAADKARYEANREAIIEQKKEYYKEHSEEIKTRIMEYQRAKASDMLPLAIEYLGGCCHLCGFDHPAALQFHHRDPAEKKYTISGHHLAKKWETLVKELDKCDLLCANCHCIHHYGHRSPSE